MNKDLQLAKKYQKEIVLLTQTASLLEWDQQTYMPEDGSASRAEQFSLLSNLIHERVTDNKLFSAVKRLRNTRLSGNNLYMLKKLQRRIENSKRLPTEFVTELSRATSLAHTAWIRAKSSRDFSILCPHLEKIVKLKRRESKFLNFPGHPYNALLDEFEEGITFEKLQPIFSALKNNLREILGTIKAKTGYKSKKVKQRSLNIPESIQRDLFEDVVKRIGLGPKQSRIDFAEHPFSTQIGMNDVRITTNIRNNPLFSFESSIHEAGHALYELNYPEKFAYTVLYDAPSLGLHESQSRFWENMIGKNKPFWRYYFPKFKKTCGIKENFKQWYKEINTVKPGLIRIESDEAHYCLHIILRFELEAGLIDGSIQVKDLPKLWNMKSKELFGISPRHDSEGVLQDVHWSGGAFGYFPSYAIGSVYAAQLYYSMCKEHPDIEKDISKGDFSAIRTWLTTKIHRNGAKYLAEELIKKTCGEGLNADIFIQYLKNKYAEIYDIRK